MKWLFRHWLEKLFGLRAAVVDEIEKSVRIDTAISGAMMRVDSLREVEEHAQELEKTHPQLAAALRNHVAALVATPHPQLAPPNGCEEPTAPAVIAAPVKRPPGRPRKPAALPPAPPSGGN
jgi:hypothetical protein